MDRSLSAPIHRDWVTSNKVLSNGTGHIFRIFSLQPNHTNFEDLKTFDKHTWLFGKESSFTLQDSPSDVPEFRSVFETTTVFHFTGSAICKLFSLINLFNRVVLIKRFSNTLSELLQIVLNLFHHLPTSPSKERARYEEEREPIVIAHCERSSIAMTTHTCKRIT